MSDPEDSTASTERRGRGHHCRPSRSRARARRTDSAAGVIGESSPVVSIPSHRAITRIPPSGDGPRPDARRTEGSDSARAMAEEASTTPRSRATSAHTIWRRREVIHPSCSGRPDALCRPRVGADAEQPGALVDADQGHPTTGERDRGAQPVAAAFRDEIEQLGLLVADARERLERAAREQLGQQRGRRSTVQPNRLSQRSSPSTHASHHRPEPRNGEPCTHHRRGRAPIGSRGARLRVPLPVLWPDLRGAPTDRGCDLGRHLPLGPRRRGAPPVGVRVDRGADRTGGRGRRLLRRGLRLRPVSARR